MHVCQSGSVFNTAAPEASAHLSAQRLQVPTQDHLWRRLYGWPCWCGCGSVPEAQGDMSCSDVSHELCTAAQSGLLLTHPPPVRLVPALSLKPLHRPIRVLE